MGNASGTPEMGDDAEQMGYRVLGVQAGSPAASAGLVSFFDFIVEADGKPLRRLDNTFIDLIKQYEDRPLAIKLYNFKSQSLRDVVITPSTKWDGQGMLGVTIRFDTFEDADEHLVRVLEVLPNSPAELAGLQPKTDYLLGTAETAFKNPDVLEEILERHLDQTVDFYVYNTETDTVRTTTLMPTLKWGGNGCLGASIGHGYLHSLPKKCCEGIGTSVFRSPQPNITDATRPATAPTQPAPPAAGNNHNHDQPSHPSAPGDQGPVAEPQMPSAEPPSTPVMVVEEVKGYSAGGKTPVNVAAVDVNAGGKQTGSSVIAGQPIVSLVDVDLSGQAAMAAKGRA